MSYQLDKVDKMLLGESDSEESGAIKTEPTEDQPLTATHGSLVKVGRGGDKIKMKGTVPTKREAATTMDTSGDEIPLIQKRSGAKKSKTDTADRADGVEKKFEPTTPKAKKQRASTGNKGSGPKLKTEDVSKGEHATKDSKTPSPSKSGQSASPSKLEGNTVRDTPRKRAAPEKPLAAPREIPTCWEYANPEDKMLVNMKEAGDDWATIRAAWKQMTGQDTAGSSLPNRYNRIKVNMMHLREGDAYILMAAKKEAESEFWPSVAFKMELKHCTKYPTAFLQKTVKKIEAAAAAAGLSAEEYLDQTAGAIDETMDDAAAAAAEKAIEAFVETGDDQNLSS